jgi:hypothetical protein
MVCKIKQHTTAEPIKDENGYAIGGIYEGVFTSKKQEIRQFIREGSLSVLMTQP